MLSFNKIYQQLTCLEVNKLAANSLDFEISDSISKYFKWMNLTTSEPKDDEEKYKSYDKSYGLKSRFKHQKLSVDQINS